MSFWLRSPGPTWSHWFWPGTTPRILDVDIGEKPRKAKKPVGTDLVPLDSTYANEVHFFLQKHFITYQKTRLCLPEERIKNGFESGWIGVGLFFKKDLIGVLISKPLGTMKIGPLQVQNTGLVDYFCVHSDWRKQGIGSCLLEELLHLTAQRRRVVHMFLKEGLPLYNMPSIYQSHYIWRLRDESQRINLSVDEETIKSAEVPYEGTLVTTHKSEDCMLYCVSGFVICVYDLHCRSVPEGLRMGEILWIKGASSTDLKASIIEKVVDSLDFEIILMDCEIPHKSKTWKKDAMFNWYVFNCDPVNYKLKPYLLL